MRKLLLLLLALLAAVGVCQETPSVAWSLQGPPAAPAPAYSPNGSWLVLTSNDGFRVLDASTLAVKWYIPSKANGNRVPVAKFALDSTSLFALTNPATGEVSEIDLTTGSVKQKANLFAAGTTAVDLAVLSTTVTAIAPSTPTVAGVPYFQVDLSVFSKSTLSALRTKTLSHTSSGVVYRLASGMRGSLEVIAFFEQEYDAATGTVSTDTFASGGNSYEAWTLGIDSTGGAIQQVQQQVPGGYSYTSIRRQNTSGGIDWTTTVASLGSASFDVGPLSFATLPGGTQVALGGSVDLTKISAISINTGAVAFTTDLGLGQRRVEFASGITYPGSASLVSRYSFADAAGTATPTLVKVGKFNLTNTGGALASDLSLLFRGALDLTQTGSTIALAGNYPLVNSLNPTGTNKWATSQAALSISAPSATNGHVATILSDRVIVQSGTTGANIGFYLGTFTGATWIAESSVAAFTSGNGMTILKFDGSSLGKPRNFVNVLHKSAKASPDGTYLAGWNNGSVVLFRVSDGLMVTSALAVGNPDAELKVIWLANDKFAVLTNPSPYTSVRWKVFTVGAGPTLTAGTDIAHTFSYTNAPTTGGVAADLTPDGAYAAFFKAKTIGNDGKPESTLVIKRVSDGVVVASYVNAFPLTKSLEIAPTLTYFFAALGGATDARGDVLGLFFPNTVATLTVPATPLYSGLSTTFTVTLTRPAKTGGQVVKITTSGSGFTFPATVTVPAGATTATFDVTAPVVAAKTDVTFSATTADNNSGYPLVSTPLSVLPAIVTDFTVTPDDVFGSETSVVAKVTIVGKLATNVSPALSTSDSVVIPVPAKVTIGGDGTGSVTLPTSRVTALATVTLGTSLNGSSLSKTVTVRPPALTAVTLIDAPTLGGDEVTYRLSLRAAAGTGGQPVAVKVEGPGGVQNFTITVPEGETSTDFTLTTPVVSAEAAYKVTGKTPGSGDISVSTTLLPAELSYYSLSTRTTKAGRTVTGLVGLSGPAGPTTDLVIKSSSSRATVPAKVRVVAGQVFATFTVNTTAGAKTTVTITVTWRSKTATKQLTITP